MMVPLMLLVRRFRVRVREQPGDALGAVDGMKFLLGACRRGTEEGFKAEPIEYEAFKVTLRVETNPLVFPVSFPSQSR